jgi:hypothetical protein
VFTWTKRPTLAQIRNRCVRKGIPWNLGIIHSAHSYRYIGYISLLYWALFFIVYFLENFLENFNWIWVNIVYAVLVVEKIPEM